MLSSSKIQVLSESGNVEDFGEEVGWSGNTVNCNLH